MASVAESDLMSWRSRSVVEVTVRVVRSPRGWISPPNCTSEFLNWQSWLGREGGVEVFGGVVVCMDE